MTRSEKMQATLAANKIAFEAQAITVDDRWRIIRADHDNWALEYKGKIWGYYGRRLHAALQALPGAMLSEHINPAVDVKNALKDIYERLKAIRERIEQIAKENNWT